MPDIRVIYWNVENFGDDPHGFRGNYVPLCNFIARVVKNVDADVLCLIELRQSAVGAGGPLDTLQSALNNAYYGGFGVGYTCDWYCDWVPGALLWNGPPYNPNNVGFTGIGRQEGYAVLWKQNITKFTMQPADDINLAESFAPPMGPGAGVVANTQSGGVKARGLFGLGFLPVGGLVTGAAPRYYLPIGSTAGPGGIMRGAFTLVPPLAASGIPITLLPGDVISTGTRIQVPGLALNTPAPAVIPTVIPGGYRLTANFTMPGPATMLVPQHVLSLVMSTRHVNWAGIPAPYNPMGGNTWRLGTFPATRQANLWNGSRRPAFCTIRTETAPAGVQQLIPITIYHTPLTGARRAMDACALSRSLYEAYVPGALPPAYQHNTRALVGGDLNAKLVPTAPHYLIYSNTYANNGADFNDGGAPNIRVNSPPPAPIPAFPPYIPPATVAMRPENRSGIMLRYPPMSANHPILIADYDAYRASAIDNIFYRGFAAALAPRMQFQATLAAGAQQQFEADLYDLLRAISGVIPPGAGLAPGGAPPDNFFIPPLLVSAFRYLPIFVGIAWHYALTQSSLAPGALWLDIQNGVFPSPWPNPLTPPGIYVPPPAPGLVPVERRAAEFIKLFVSDHLPVLFRMNI